jgi:hypothetical protein
MFLPEVDWCWALQHKMCSPSFTGMYEDEKSTLGWVGSWLGCSIEFAMF